MANAELDALVRDNPGCQLAAFADLGSSMVLVTSVAEGRPAPQREHLDALCAEATRMLPVADFEEDDAARGATALSFSSGGLKLFLRLESSPTEALCCICDRETPVDQLLADAQARLARLVSSEET
ncbi:hypothetical protein [Jannaschia aquimarina]|nr:hypothetical protein [Jannaschia aquimarina]SNT25529.1 hypothetical protein SAMN05421775_10924 [Jannaschia aquimarina]